jgi:hypothetical protein
MKRHFTFAHKRHGSIVVLAAFLLIVMLILLALSIDSGYMYTRDTQLDRAVDASALAGVAALSDGVDSAEEQAVKFLIRNDIRRPPIAIDDADLAKYQQIWLTRHRKDLKITAGHWINADRRFEESDSYPSALRVTMRHNNLPLFFGRMAGRDRFSIESTAIATYRPREIMVVLDLSASMNDDSEFRSMDRLGVENIVANLRQIWNELGQPTYGSLTFDPVPHASSNVEELLSAFGLTDVDYPYPIGSWSDYLFYVMYDGTLNEAGYRRQYGALTLVHYWLARQPAAGQTPDLWQVSAMPMQAVKDAVEVFTSNVQVETTNDRVGLVVYNGLDGNANRETGLTEDLDHVNQLTRRKQAGHYHGYTNTGAGLRMAVDELKTEGRRGGFQMVVLLTDGQANWGSEGYGVEAAREELLQAANECGNARIPVMTISLGASADTALMAQVAEVTGGRHFNVPGGQSVSEYTEELIDVFRGIAGLRPVRLVQ